MLFPTATEEICLKEEDEDEVALASEVTTAAPADPEAETDWKDVVAVEDASND